MDDITIRKNAEEYYDKLGNITIEVEREPNSIVEAYIEGACSRDEEISELKNEVESLQEQYDTLFDGFKKRGKKLGELMKENVKLKNSLDKCGRQIVR